MLKRFSSSILSAASVVGILALWLAFAPLQAGGLASYIVVIGSSMEPKFHIGDLVIVHKEPSYQTGDAVVYRNRELSSFVFHRIISQNDSHYVLQGDNNSWVDTYQPTQNEVLGKLWLYIPRGGVTIQKLRSPIGMALIAAVLGAVFAGSFVKHQTKGGKNMNKKSIHEWFISIQQKVKGMFSKKQSPNMQQMPVFDLAGNMEVLFFSMGLVFLFSLIFAIVSFSRPASRIIKDETHYQHLGIFTYHASAPQGVYDQNAIKSGDPIFPGLTCLMDVNFQYTLIVQQAENITGTYQLTALIREQVSGWERKISLQEATPFTGTTFGTTATLDLCKLESLVKSMEEETDFHPGTYLLLISPTIQLNGEIQGKALEGTFDPNLTFIYDRIHFYLFRDQDAENPLSFKETGILSRDRSGRNMVSFLGKEFSVPALRWLSVIGLLLSVAGLAGIALQLQTLSRNNQGEFIRIQYNSMMVDVQNMDALTSSTYVDVTSVDALAKLAERFNTAILHMKGDDTHSYYVHGAGIVYRFETIHNKVLTSIPAGEEQ